MTRPDFKAVAGKAFDDCLKGLFLEELGYYKIERDPDDKDPDRSEAWRMILPIQDSLPLALAYQKGLHEMDRPSVSKLYIERVIPHRDGNPTVAPVLYGFGDGTRFVFFSADPSRNRDDRFDLCEETYDFQSVRDKYARLHRDQLECPTRLGRKRPKVEFLFEAHPLSADERFKRYVHFVREELMRAVLEQRKALGTIIYHLLEVPENRPDKTHFANKDGKLKKSPEDLHLQLGMRLGDAVGAAVDTLLLRYLMIRFLESYHPEAMNGLLGSKELLARGKGGKKTAPPKGFKGAAGMLALFGKGGAAAATFTDVELELAEKLTEPLGIDVSKAKKKAKGMDERQGDLFVFEDEQTLAETVLSEEHKRKVTLGGDFYLADLGRAAQSVEEALLAHPRSKGAKLLQDFLGRTGAPEMAHWSFRYEDLRPQALQDYYESSLGTAVQLAWDEKVKDFKIAVGKTQRLRKELGAFYTDLELCRFMVEQTVKPLFEERLAALRKAIGTKDLSVARGAFHGLVGLSICDPTMGSAPFLRSTFDYLSEQYLPLCRVIAEAKSTLPGLLEDVSKDFPFLTLKAGRMDEDGVGRWEWHILRRMLYGVDVDLKAVCIASQTFALSALKYLHQGERFPSFFNLNLKLGNALISAIKPGDREGLASEHGKAIARLVRLRREATTLPNTAKAYERLATILNEIDEIKWPIVRDLVQERVAPILQEHTDDIRPFCWELEFPEVFFTADGTLKDVAGFDAMIGNAPWEAFRPRDKEFFNALEPGFRFESKEHRDKRKASLLKRPGVAKRYEHYCAQIEAQRRFVIESDLYRFQFPTVWGERQTSDVNTFKCTLERTLDLAKLRAARFCLILQSGVSRDIGSRDLRRESVRTGRVVGIWEFRNKTDGQLIFPTVDPNQRFVLFAVARGESSNAIPYRYCKSFTDLTEIKSDDKCASIDLVERVSGDAFEFQTVEDPLLLSVLEKLYAFPRLDDVQRKHLIAVMREELHTGKYAGIFRSHDTGVPLWEGSLVQHYTISPHSKRWVDSKAFAPLDEDSKYSRVVIRRILPNSARRIYAGLVPSGIALTDSLSYFVPTQPLAQKLFLLAYLNSLVIEHRLLQSISGITLGHYRVEALPVPDWPDSDSRHRQIVEGVASIVATDKRFRKELRDNGFESRASDDVEAEKCRIDALVARTYGLTPDELEALLDTFEKLDKGVRTGVRDAYLRLGEAAT